MPDAECPRLQSCSNPCVWVWCHIPTSRGYMKFEETSMLKAELDQTRHQMAPCII